MKIIGHRGVRRFGKENNLLGIKEGLKQGAEIIEVDIRKTLNGLILSHDKTKRKKTTLKEALETFKNTKWLLHIKEKGLKKDLLNIIKKTRTKTRNIIIEAEYPILKEYKAVKLKKALLLHLKHSLTKKIKLIKKEMKETKADILTLHPLWAPSTIIQELKKEGKEVWTYGKLNKYRTKSLEKRGVSGLIVDIPRKFKKKHPQ